MDKPKTLPRPLPAHTWAARHLNALKAEVLALGGAPDKEPTADEAHAFAAELPYRNAHVQEARYNVDHKRVEVRLHGGGIAFHVPVCEPKEAEEEAPATPKRDGITRTVVVGA